MCTLHRVFSVLGAKERLSVDDKNDTKTTAWTINVCENAFFKFVQVNVAGPKIAV